MPAKLLLSSVRVCFSRNEHSVKAIAPFNTVEMFVQQVRFYKLFEGYLISYVFKKKRFLGGSGNFVVN